jgi:WD40 repeat protein
MAYSNPQQRAQPHKLRDKLILVNRQSASPWLAWTLCAIASSLLMVLAPARAAYPQDREAGGQKKEAERQLRPDAESLRRVKRIQLPGEAKLAILRGQGKYLAVWLENQTVQIWDVNSGRQLRQFKAPKDLFGISLTDDGKRLVMVHGASRLGYRDTIVVWDVMAGREVAVLKGRQSLSEAVHPRRLLAIAWAPPDGVVQVVDSANGKEVSRIPLRDLVRYHRPILAISPDGQHLAMGIHDKSSFRKNLVLVWDLASGRELALLDHTPPSKEGQNHLPPDEIQILEFSPDGRLLATGTTSLVRLWEVATGREAARLEIRGGCKNLRFSSDSRLLATAVGRKVFSSPEIPGIRESERTVKVWDTATGRGMASFLHDDTVAAVIFSPVAHLLATLSGGFPGELGEQGPRSDSVLSLWEVATGKKLARLADPSHYSMNFQEDGQHLVAWGTDNVLEVWRLPVPGND